MEYDELAQQTTIIEDNLESLRQAISFMYQDYDYHHKNNELQILEKQLTHLLKAKEDLKSTNDAYKELTSKLEEAKQKRAEALRMLEEAKMLDTDLSDGDDDRNSENINPV